MPYQGSRTGPVYATRDAVLPDIGTNGLTMIGWWRRPSAPAHSTFECLMSVQGNGDYISLYENSSNAQIRLYGDTGGNFTVFNPISDNTWYFFAVTQDTAATPNVVVYWRTEAETSLSSTSSTTVRHGGAGESDFRVGNSHFGNEAAEYDSCGLKLFDRALTEAESYRESLQLLPASQNCIGFFPQITTSVQTTVDDIMGQDDLIWTGGTPTLVQDGPNVSWGSPVMPMPTPAAAATVGLTRSHPLAGVNALLRR